MQIDGVEIFTKHLCGGWFQCPYCPRIYCACVTGLCYSCGHPLTQELHIQNPKATIKANGGRSENVVEIK